MSNWRFLYTVLAWLFLFLFLWYVQCDCSVRVYNFHVLEEQQAGHVIGKINEKPLSSNNVSFVYSREDFASLFAFNYSNGIIYTKKPIDREALADDIIHIVAYENENIFADITIYVVDINDNQPTFLKTTQNIAISESALIGEKFELQLPIDLDTVYNGLISDISLELSMYSSLFTLHYEINERLLYVCLLQKLDRERLDNIVLTLKATDSGEIPKYGRGYVNITVLDVNDNPPRFQRLESEVYLLENTSLSQHVITMNVTDADIGESCRLSYALSGSNSNLFEINDRGDIFLMKSFHYESTPYFNLNVTAKDHGVKPLSSHAILRIIVIDVNNHPPSIRVEKSNPISIDENNKPNTIISVVTVFDGDTMKSNRELKLVLENYRSEFILQRQSYVYTKNTTTKSLSEIRYVLRAMQSFDFELKAFYNIKLKAFDDFYNTSMYTIKVMVTDINDNSPIFNTSASNDAFASVHTPVGSYITTVSAIDDDKSDEKKIRYILLNTTFSQYFDIISDTGVMVTAAKLPSLLPELLTLNILANDSVHSTSCLQKVYVKQNSADCIPKILTYPDRMYVNRYPVSNLVLAKYETNNCPITWSITGKNSSLFSINERGELCHSLTPSMETTLALKVMVWNTFNSKLYSSVSTIVKIISNRKELFFEKGLYYVSMAKHNLFGVYVTRVHIPNTRANYWILQQNDYITINPLSGDVYVHKHVHKALSSASCFIFTVSANISANNEHAKTNLLLLGNDLTTHGEVKFQRDKYFFSIYENSPIGSIVGRVILDIPENLTKGFYVENGNVRDVLSSKYISQSLSQLPFLNHFQR